MATAKAGRYEKYVAAPTEHTGKCIIPHNTAHQPDRSLRVASDRHKDAVRVFGDKREMGLDGGGIDFRKVDFALAPHFAREQDQPIKIVQRYGLNIHAVTLCLF